MNPNLRYKNLSNISAVHRILSSISSENSHHLSTAAFNDDLSTQNQSDISAECRVLEFLPWSNPDNVITFQTQLLFFRVFGGVLIPCVSLFGIPVNILNCVVFFKQGLRERINFLLFCLSCSDFIVSGFMFVSTLEYFYTQILGNFQISGPLASFVINYGSILYGTVYVSGFISTLIAFERCICITYPFIAKQILKTKTMAVIVLVASVILITLMYLVSAIKFRIGCGYYPPFNLKLDIHYPSDFYLENKTVLDVLNGIVYGICLPVIFGLATTITTIITAIKLKGAAAWRQNTSSVAMEAREIALTRMLVVVSCLFIGCTIPNVVLRIAPVVVKELKLGGRHQNMLMSGVSVVYLSNTVNSAFNFIFYYKMGSKFRMTLIGLCCSKQGDSEPVVPAKATTGTHQCLQAD